jgi:hypothetical protein
MFAVESSKSLLLAIAAVIIASAIATAFGIG